MGRKEPCKNNILKCNAWETIYTWESTNNLALFMIFGMSEKIAQKQIIATNNLIDDLKEYYNYKEEHYIKELINNGSQRTMPK